MLDAMFAVSVALAHAATNLDNLAFLFAMIPATGLGRAASGYVGAQMIALAAAAAVGAGFAGLPASVIPWLGPSSRSASACVPFGFGIAVAPIRMMPWRSAAQFPWQ